MKTPEIILKFYHSRRWKLKKAYIKAKYRGICQECGKAGWEVHHIIPLTINNVSDDEIALGDDNLILLCTSCHDAMRSQKKELRFDLMFDDKGNIIPKNTPRVDM